MQNNDALEKDKWTLLPSSPVASHDNAGLDHVRVGGSLKRHVHSGKQLATQLGTEIRPHSTSSEQCSYEVGLP